MKIIIAPYTYLSNVYTTKWYQYIKHMIDDFGWECIDISDNPLLKNYGEKHKLKQKINLNEYLKSHIEDTLTVDIVLFFGNTHFKDFSNIFCNIDNNKFKLGIYYDDVHQTSNIKNEECGKYMDIVFSSSPRTAIELFIPNALHNYHFIPHGATIEFNVNFNIDPVRKIILSGAISEYYYPHRSNFLNIMNYNNNLKDYIYHLNHPGYHNKSHNIVGDKYAKKINEYLCGFASSGVHKVNDKRSYYVVSKLFEIAGTGALVMINDEISNMLKDLGFVHMENCIIYNKKSIIQNINFILDIKNRIFIDNIRKKGQDLVYEKHMAINRAEQMDNIVLKNITNI